MALQVKIMSAWIAIVCIGPPLSFFLFSTFLYQDQPDRNGTVFSPEFPVGAQLVFIHSKWHCLRLRVRSWRLLEQPKLTRDLPWMTLKEHASRSFIPAVASPTSFRQFVLIRYSILTLKIIIQVAWLPADSCSTLFVAALDSFSLCAWSI